MTRGLFVTATGTGVGKTFVTRGLAAALCRAGRPAAAIKPLETDCNPSPGDALALARACGRPALAHAPGLYRAHAPLAPYAATLAGEPAPPHPATLAQTVHGLLEPTELALVEGAGGLLVPLDADHTMADLAAALHLPVLVVAADGLGVLSATLTAVESARARDLSLAAVVLVRLGSEETADPSPVSNARILEERLPDVPIKSFPACRDDDAALADAADISGLSYLL